MAGSLREIDITVPARRSLPQVRRNDLLPRPHKANEVREMADKPSFRPTENLASGKGVALPRFRHALDVYQQNMDARRTLLSGPFFVDTYA
jgi:hypothetical protein